MQNIIQKALELAGYKDADTLVKIISYVPNPQVAAAMLLGVHEPRTVNTETRYRKHKYKSHKEILMITGYDELANTVQVTTFNRNTKQAWYITKEDKAHGEYTFVKPEGDYHDWDYIGVQGYVKSDRVMSIDTFEEDYSTVISPLEAVAILRTWEGVEEETTL